MSHWFATPHAALAAVRTSGKLARLAVLDLYERAHLTGYAPMPFTGRELAEEWGVDRDRAEAILRQLAAAGCITLERSAPGSKRPSMLTVVPPVSTENSQTPRQTPRQTSSQNNDAPPPLSKAAPPELPPDAAPDAAPACAEKSRADQTRPDQTREEQEHAGPGALRLLLVEDEAEAGAPGAPEAPQWATREARRGATAPAFAEHVIRALEAIRGSKVDPKRCGTEAAVVIGLWRAVGRPPIADLADDLALVARWAREAPAAANDIRGMRPDGTVWGADRSRSVATLCRRAPWGDRLAEAQRWSSSPARAAPRDGPLDPTTALSVRSRIDARHRAGATWEALEGEVGASQRMNDREKAYARHYIEQQRSRSDRGP